jgi:foldase protein PrsA
VGRVVISTRALSGALDRAVAEPAFKDVLVRQFGDEGTVAYQAALADQERAVLTRLIEHELLVKMAAEQHVTVTETEVDTTLKDLAQQRQGLDQLELAAAQAGIAKSDLRDAIRDVVLTNDIRDALVKDVKVSTAALHGSYDRAFVQVHTAHILVKTEALARSLMSQLQAGASFAALAKKYSQDAGSKASGGDLGFNGAGRLLPQFETAMYAARPGQTIGPVKTQLGYHIIKVISRRTAPGAKSFTELTPDLRRQALDAQSQQRFHDLQTKTTGQLGISVSPRFGVWNDKAGKVDPPPARVDLASPSAAPANAPAG